MSLFRTLIVFLLGLTTGLWLMERQKRQALEAEKLRPSRTIEELSPTYKQFAVEFDAAEGDYTLKSPEEHADRIQKVLKEVDFAGLNPVETGEFKKKIMELVNFMWIDAQELIDPGLFPSSYESEE